MIPVTIFGVSAGVLWVIAFLYGVIIGSFLNVYIYRFNTGKSLSGSSHCLSCGHALRPYDLFPLASYLFLRGRCRDCKSKITPRYFVVELVTGLLFASALMITEDVISLLLLWWFLSIMVVIAVYDLNHFIIPDKLTLISSFAAGLLLLYQAWLEQSFVSVSYAAAAALGGVLFFYVLWRVSKGTWLGFGDVKLAFPLGLIVAPEGVFSMVVLSFWVGAAISVGMLLIASYGRGKLGLRLHRLNLTMKSAVPFAPFMIAGCLIVLFTNANVLNFFSF